ncbi:MAG TPA: hypothetical protein VN578_14840 [Candidatus Binatia bacterium]|jgi:hypothetical protein|nr:hypothetical protein [Candidatus Binatia bacterium]
MLSENRQFQAKLAGVVRKVTSDAGLHDELVQVAMAWVSRLEVKNPGQKQSWYVKACDFYVHDYLGQGRSLDAPKRRCLGCPIEVMLGDGDCPVEGCLIAEGDPFQEASMADLVEALKKRLGIPERQVLLLLVEGYSDRQIGRKVGGSHTTVKHRREKIATVARRIGCRKEWPQKNTARLRRNQRVKWVKKVKRVK